ncbi:MAG: hypothetical protein EOP45_09675 [Sphingobacteriaceae bacterium]|nr:MAG: hypothetical protein EOP45_09675 [Sphingobacteriaceae bacterium]
MVKLLCLQKVLGTDWLPDDKETKFKLPVAIRAISAATNSETDESKTSTLALLAKYLKTLGKCAWCGSECDVTKRVGNGFIMKRTGANLTGQQIFNIFKDIRHDDCLFMRLGDNVRPEWFLFYCLDVVPPVVRPEKMTNGRTSQDDLTIALKLILKYNQALKDVMRSNGLGTAQARDAEDLLQTAVTLYYDPKYIKPTFYKNARLSPAMCGVVGRLRAKEGRLRGNLMGKRVDQCARNVITGDSYLGICEVGVPHSIAMDLTVPVKVTRLNIDHLRRVIDLGAFALGGAKNILSLEYGEITDANGEEYRVTNLQYASEKYRVIKEGDIVERYLNDGDYVVMNRQPTLHRNSALAHRVKVMKGTTFRLNVAICPGYNADFDGDEMNLHLPQSLDAQAELEQLMAVEKNMISTQTGRPMMSLHQDSLLAVYLMTQPNQRFNYHTVIQFCYDLPNFQNLICPSQDHNKNNGNNRNATWSGTEIFSILFPADFHYSKNKCTIENGQITYCPNGISKDHIGPKSDGIMHILHRYHGAKVCVEFLDNAQTLLRRFMEYEGFSVGIKDCMLIRDQTAKTKQSPNGLCPSSSTIFDDFKPILGTFDYGEDEMLARIELQKEMMRIGESVQKNVSSNGRINRFTAMMKAGSKGSTTNLTQICGIVGQQLVNGQRIHRDFPERTLSHFQKFDNTANARGYVQGNYINGLSPTEFFFHAAGGREGLTEYFFLPFFFIK